MRSTAPLILFFTCMGLTFSAKGQNSARRDSLHVALKEQFGAADTIVGGLYLQLSREYRGADNFRSLDYALRAREICTKCPAPLRFDIIVEIMNSYTDMDNTAKALDIGFNTLHTFKQMDTMDSVSIYADIGRCYSYRRDRKRAVKYLGKAIEILRRVGDQEVLMFMLNNLGSLYTRMGRYDDALKIFEETDQIQSRYFAQERRHEEDIHRWSHLGYVYLHLGDLAKGKNYLEQAEKLLPTSFHPEYRMMLWEFWAKYYELSGNHSKALDLLEKLHYKAQGQRHNRFQIIALEQRAIVLKKQGNLAAANEALYDLSALKDSLALAEIHQLELTMNKNLELEIKQHQQKEKAVELRASKLKSDLAAGQFRYQRNMFLTIGSMAILVLIILVYFLRYKSRLASLNRQKAELAQGKLELELEKKNANLSHNMLRLTHLNELIQEIQKAMEENKKSVPAEHRNAFNAIIRKIKSNADNNMWEEFELQFDQIHSGFYSALIRDYPDLSTNERRLCAFFKLNMRTKEIAAITGQSVNSINVARTRLRKRLGLTNDETGLVEFIQKY